MEDKSALSNDRECVLREAEKIAVSPLLRTSESLCRLLRYLAQQAVDQPETHPKEYQIATEVFGRPPDFDPRLDSTVRFQTGRLRSKLVEYFAGLGVEDDVILRIPKGAYSLSFEHRSPPATTSAPASPHEQPAQIIASQPAPAPRFVSNTWLLVLLVVGMGTIGFYVWSRTRGDSESGRSAPSTRIFWQEFLANKQLPLVIFSNAEFVGSPIGGMGMRNFIPGTDSPREVRDTYTGIGEVFAVHEMDRLFASFGSDVRLKRGRLLDWDNAKGSNLIFLGSTIENQSLRELPMKSDFEFRSAEDPSHNSDWKIINLQPAPGEEAAYVPSLGVPKTEDVALIVLLPAPESGHWVLILAGTTTLGTEAAAEFVCHPETLRDLVKRLHLSDGSHPVPFEAVIKTAIAEGVPIQSDIVALHIRQQNHSK